MGSYTVNIGFRSAVYWMCLIGIVFLMQATDLKMGSVKVSELILLGLFPYLIIKNKVSKIIIMFVLFFSLWVVVTFVLNVFQDFYLKIELLAFLKRPYIITISRYVEFLSIISFILLVKKLLHRYGEYRNVVVDLIFVNFVFTIPYVFEYIMYYAGVVDINSALFNYGAGRMKGMFVEGGPFGLYIGFLFCFGTIFKTSRFYLIWFVIVILMSQSKAGIILIMAWFIVLLYSKIKWDLRAISFGIVGISIGMAILISVFGADYLNAVASSKDKIAQRTDDNNFVMGRISAMHIVPNIVKSNPILGVGLGNYSLIRNNPRYREYFPHVELWDLTGLGGIVTMVAEYGLFGLVFFLAILIKSFKIFTDSIDISFKQCLILFAVFIFPLILGVQFFFHYFWLSFSYMLYRLHSSQDARIMCKCIMK